MSSIPGYCSPRPQSVLPVQTLLSSFNNENVTRNEIAKVQACSKKRLSQLRMFYGFLSEQSGVYSKIYQQAYRLCENLLTSHQATWKEKAQLIGKIVFVIEREKMTGKIGAGIDPSSHTLEGSLKFIGENVLSELTELQKCLFTVNASAKQFLLPQPDHFLRVEKFKILANCLLTSQGQLNLGIIEAIQEARLEKVGEKFSENEHKIIHILNLLDSSCQEALDTIEIPNAEASNAQAMVRADLGLFPQETLTTKRDCQVVALAALLHHYAKVPDHQFMIAWERRKEIIADFKALIQEGCLSCKINGKRQSFFFETDIPNAALDRLITLLPNGQLKGCPDLFFWDCPSFMAATYQMGIKNIQSFSAVLLTELFLSKAPSTQITWEELLKKCAILLATSSYPAEEKFTLGKYAFSLHFNRLLKAWEETCVSMVQGF